MHVDSIGEYKAEFMKISFDKTTAEVSYHRERYDEHQEIRKIDLNKLGYQSHVLRQGEYSEKVFYGCKLIDNKKVFTVRSKYQMVNWTPYSTWYSL